MSTKLYIANTEVVPGYIPPTNRGAWDLTTGYVSKALTLSLTKWDTITTKGTTETSATLNYDVLLLKAISSPLSAQAISGTVDILLGVVESSLAANDVYHIHIFVTVGNTDVVRGTLLTDYIDSSEWPLSAQGKALAAAQALTLVNAQAGDRIVVEIGYQAQNNVTTSFTGTVYYGTVEGASDLTVGSANVSTEVGYIIFSANLTFEVVSERVSQIPTEVGIKNILPSERVSQLTLEAVIKNILPDERVSQVVIEVGVVPPRDTRVSQLAIEVLVQPPRVAPTFVTPIALAQADYLIKIYDIYGNLKAVFDDWKDLQIEHTLNSYSTHIFSIDDNDTRQQYFTLDCFVEINRKISGGNWYREYIGFHRTKQRQVTEGRHKIFTSYGRGLVDLLHRREILYPATTAFTLKAGPGETVIKEFVNENAGPGAINALRYVQQSILGLAIEVDVARGLHWAGQRSSKNLLETIQDIAAITSVDFDVVWLGGQNFEFRCYYPQKGVDRRATLAFSPELGNMITPSYTHSRTEEATICVVLGEGKGKKRRYVVRQGNTLYDSPWNNIEITKDARNDSSYASYISAGDEALAAASPKESFTFEVQPISTSQYGRDYIVGDVVTVNYGSIYQVKKLVGISLQAKQGKETIKSEFSDFPELK